MKIKKAMFLFRIILGLGILICVIPIIISFLEKKKYQREAFLIDSFKADVEAYSSEDDEVWYITIAVDRSKGVIDDAFADAYKMKLKGFIDLLHSKEIMPDTTSIWVNISVFDGVVDNVLDEGTAHDISKGFLNVSESELNCEELKKEIDNISFEATSTYVEGAIWGCQALLDQYVRSEDVRTMILLFTDGFDENIGDDGGTGTQKILADKGAQQEYEISRTDGIKKAEIISIALNIPENDSDERTKGREALRQKASNTRYGNGVFVEENREESKRSNYCEINELSKLTIALWDICDYISPRLKKVYYEQDGLRFEAHGVKNVRLYMLKPDETNNGDAIKVFYKGKMIDTEPLGILSDANSGRRLYCECETVELKSDNNAKLGNSKIEIKYGGQPIKNIYAVLDGLDYEIECSCRPRTEADNIPGNTIYIGKILLKPYLKEYKPDPNLKMEVVLPESYLEADNLEDRSPDVKKLSDGSYEVQIPIDDSSEELELTIIFYAVDAENERHVQQTIDATLRLDEKTLASNYVAGKTLYEGEKTIEEGDTIAIDLRAVLPGIHLKNIKVEPDLKYDIDEQNEVVVLKEMKRGEKIDYTITGEDDSSESWTVTGKINVQKKNLVVKYLLPVFVVACLLLIIFSEIIKRDRSNALQVRICVEGGEELNLMFRKIKGGNNSLDYLLDSVRAKCSPLKLPDEEIFKKIIISKKASGIIVIIDKNENKRVEKTLSKNGDYYRVTENVELSMVKLK